MRSGAAQLQLQTSRSQRRSSEGVKPTPLGLRFAASFRGFGFAASSSRLRLRGLVASASREFNFEPWALRPRLRLHSFGFTPSASRLLFRTLNFACLASSHSPRLRWHGFVLRLQLRRFATAASSRWLRHFEFSFLSAAPSLRLRGFGFAAFAWRLRLCGYSFAASASRLQLCGFRFSALALRMQLHGFGIVASALRLRLRLRRFGHMASA